MFKLLDKITFIHNASLHIENFISLKHQTEIFFHSRVALEKDILWFP